MGASVNDVEDIVRRSQENQDPDTIPAGGVQATTTEEARREARKLLARIPATDKETEDLKKQIKLNADQAKDALQRAHNMLTSSPEYFFPSQSERLLQQSAALMAPHPNVPQSGALNAEFGNLYATEAAQQAADREAH